MPNPENYKTEYDEKARTLKIYGVRDFDPVHTFECGQCFRWEAEPDGSYTGVVGGRAFTLRTVGGLVSDSEPAGLHEAGSGTVIIENCRLHDFEDIWFDYLDLGRDYGKIKEQFCESDDVMKKAVAYGGGIRILRQDPWETVVSFIISQNSNIPRIRKCISALCKNFGEPAGEWKDRKIYSFPTASRLAGLTQQDLAVCKLGYRDKYIIETAKIIDSDGREILESMKTAPYGDARDYVSKLYGVGPKVANCILLFGLSRYESFPLDVWMKRVMSELYGFEITDMKGMAKYASERFGSLGGFAQQYLFYYARDFMGK